MVIPFQHIDFGSSAAENEAIDNKSLLIEGYLDLHRAYAKCLNKPHFLVIGYKGAGKTALGQHLALSAPRRGIAARVIKLEDLPFSEFPKVATGADSWQLGYPAIWTFHLLLQLIDSFRHDSSQATPFSEEFLRVINALEASGHLPAEDLSAAIRHFSATSETMARAVPPDPRHPLLGLQDVADRLIKLIQQHVTVSRHMLVIDGLDEILDPEVDELRVLTSLTSAANHLNGELAKAPTPAKVIVLCRTDLFNRLPGANTAKDWEDRAIELNWYQHTREPHKSHLVQLLNLKARVSDASIDDVVTEYFPHKVRGQNTLELLLEHTRHTPRDFLRIFRYVQEFVDTTGRRITHAQLMQGLRAYSAFFGREVRNEMSGYASKSEIDYMADVLSRVNRVTFTLADVRTVVKRDASGFDPIPLLHRLFDCSAIGNVDKVGGNTRYTFKFRNPGATLNVDAPMRIHVGWRKDLNLVGGETSDRSVRVSAAKVSGERTRSRVRRKSSQVAPGQLALDQAAEDPPPLASPVPATPPPSSGLPSAGPEGRRTRRVARRPQGPPDNPSTKSPNENV